MVADLINTVNGRLEVSASDYTDWVEKPAVDNTVAGDPHDDDATYVDDLLQEVQAPADMSNTGIVVPTKFKPVPPGRMFTGSQSWNTLQSDQISQLLPFDAKRTSLHVRAIGTGTDYIAIADDPGKLAYGGGSGGALIMPVGTTICLDSYTGPVYARPIGIGQTFAANNLLAPSAAQPTSLTGWVKQAADTQALIAAPWDATRQAIQITAAGGAVSFAIGPPTVVNVVAGQTIWVRAKIQASATINLTLRLYSGTSTVSLATAVTQTVPSGGTFDLAGSVVSPISGAVRVAFVTTSNPTAGDTYAFGDCVISNAGMPAKYFDANTANDSTYKITANSDGSASATAFGTIAVTWDGVSA